MKYQNFIKRISAFILSLAIAIVSALFFSVPVFAVTGGGHSISLTGGRPVFDDIRAMRYHYVEMYDSDNECFNFCTECFSSLLIKAGCVINIGEFENFINKNEDCFTILKSVWNDDNIYLTSDNVDGSDAYVSFSADLITAIKLVIKEYQGVQYGFQILPTVKISTIPASFYRTSYEYRTANQVCSDVGLMYFYRGGFNSFMNFGDLSPYLNGSVGLYINSSGTNTISGLNYYHLYALDYLTWGFFSFNNYTVDRAGQDTESGFYLEQTLSTWEEVVENCYSISTNTLNLLYYFPQYGFLDGYNSFYSIVSSDGRDILVFNSKTALQNYSVDQRGIFTISGFYEDTGALTVSIDDLNSSIGELTDLLDQFKDLIGDQDGLTESQLEELLEKFLDEFFNRLSESGSGDSDNSSGSTNTDIDDTNSRLDDIFNRLGDILKTMTNGFNDTINRLEAVVLGIDNLSYQIEELTEAEMTEKADSMVSSMADEFSEIGDMMSTKFPFSLPWDIYCMFSLFSGGSATAVSTGDVVALSAGDTVLASTSLVTVYSRAGSEETDTEEDDTGRDSGGQSVGDRTFGGHYSTSTSGAPVFKIPVVIESAGIDETIDIDMSNFDILSRISRTMFTAIFSIGLCNLTFKVIGLGKDIFG